jgi:hypothetical protein
MKKSLSLLTLMAIISVSGRAQFYVTPDSNAVQLVNNFILSGVAAFNVQYTGADSTLGHFIGGGLTNLGMTDGIAMTTGTFDTAKGPSIGDSVGAFACFSNGSSGDSLLNTLIAPWQTYEASILEFDLTPVGNVLEFKYVFASEEYPEFVGSSFNDVFGFFISGPDTAGGNYSNFNIALIPGTTMPVAINNVNADTNAAYFVDNHAMNGQTIVFDGFTTVLTAKLNVVPSAIYHLKMAVSDAGDGVFDSGIFLKAQSMKSYFITGTDEHRNCASHIYPNPVSAYSVIDIYLKEAGNVMISVFDNKGRLVTGKTQTCNMAGTYHVNIGSMIMTLPSGIYFMGIQTPDGYTSEKILKQ